MSMQADALILLTAVPEPRETEAAKWVLEAAHILRQVAHPSFEADQRDAARYRFIRDMQFGVKGAPQPPQDGGDWWGEVLGNTYGEAFTAVVDAAMSAQSDTEGSK